MNFKSLAGSVFLLSMAIMSSTALAQDIPPVPTLPSDHPYAAFLDTYRFALEQGATAEWRKLEWVAIDALNTKVYFAVSTMDGSMSDDEGDLQLEENSCGAIFMGEYDDDMNMTSISPVLLGGTDYDGDSLDPCDVEEIAGPDNLVVDNQGNLWIGEDTEEHQNNVLWVWNPNTHDLKRFATFPFDAEVTGVHIADDGKLFLNVSHPEDLNQPPFDKATIGYVKGFTVGDDFESLSVPTTPEERTTLRLAAGEYHVFGRAGDEIPGAPNHLEFGDIVGVDGETFGSSCTYPDGNVFIPQGDNKAVLYTNFECYLGGISELWLEKDAAGLWNATEGTMLDFNPVRGTSYNCGSSLSPWNTMLSSEEYPPDYEERWGEWFDTTRVDMSEVIGTAANPFDYGYTIEVTPTETGTEIVKHYAMGRFSKENSIVMPDRKTVYMGDDGTDRMFFKFIADTPDDLSAGTLYAAKFTQAGSALTIEWIELGHATDAELHDAIRALDSQFTYDD